MIIGVDGGNTKTDVVVASLDGEVLANLRGPGSNSHGPGGAPATVDVIASLVEQARFEPPAAHGAFFLCGADVPQDIADLSAAIEARAWVRAATVDNDAFAVLHAGTERADAVAVVCGAGINCVGRAADGRIARYPSLGWETGDWGGADMLGREALFVAARAEDGRSGVDTTLVDVVRAHFESPTVREVGEAIHYGRIPSMRLGELAPAIVAAAANGDGEARSLAARLAREIGLLVERAFRDLRVTEAAVVLGGGMLRGGGLLYDEAVTHMPPGARPLALSALPVLGAALAALDNAGATGEAKARLREELRAR